MITETKKKTKKAESRKASHMALLTSHSKVSLEDAKRNRQVKHTWSREILIIMVNASFLSYQENVSHTSSSAKVALSQTQPPRT